MFFKLLESLFVSDDPARILFGYWIPLLAVLFSLKRVKAMHELN